MKKITLKQRSKSVSATLPEETSLDEALSTVEGLLLALGYCFEGHLDITDGEL